MKGLGKKPDPCEFFILWTMFVDFVKSFLSVASFSGYEVLTSHTMTFPN